ncbi:hypothetical protein [uncultured Mameliella sp.]|uniref:hypothetical protein n=2 Tax=Mameliella TaxID=1434019 RepID=UPI00260DB03F|nr:hypothetical protein [uncultured Mameliella sp.]
MKGITPGAQMDDLYDEVMALLHDTGAFAHWQQDAAILRRVEQTRRSARSEQSRPHTRPDRRSRPRQDPESGS